MLQKYFEGLTCMGACAYFYVEESAMQFQTGFYEKKSKQ